MCERLYLAVCGRMAVAVDVWLNPDVYKRLDLVVCGIKISKGRRE